MPGAERKPRTLTGCWRAPEPTPKKRAEGGRSTCTSSSRHPRAPKIRDNPPPTGTCGFSPLTEPAQAQTAAPKSGTGLENFAGSAWLSPPTSDPLPSAPLRLTDHSLQAPGSHRNSQQGWGWEGTCGAQSSPWAGSQDTSRPSPGALSAASRELSHPWGPAVSAPDPSKLLPVPRSHKSRPRLLPCGCPTAGACPALKLGSNSARSAPNPAEFGRAGPS